MKEFIKRIVVDLNDNMDKAPLMTGKSPKDYRDLGKKDYKEDKEKDDEERV